MIVNADIFHIPTTEKFDLIIFDPPYGIGSTKMSLPSRSWQKTSEKWDSFSSFEEQYEFYKQAFEILFSRLKENGNMFVFGSMHSIFICGEIIQRLRKKIVNSIVWNKINAMFNLTRSSLIEGTEYIIWSTHDSSHFFDYEYAVSVSDKQMRNVWNSPKTPNKELVGHPHQKPAWLIQRLIKIGCPIEGSVLDPMCGSGTTAIICQYEGLKYLCLDKNLEYCKIAKTRVKQQKDIF